MYVTPVMRCLHATCTTATSMENGKNLPEMLTRPEVDEAEANCHEVALIALIDSSTKHQTQDAFCF